MKYTSPPYFDNPFDCSCKNDNGVTNFEPVWEYSGSCCANLRLTIWLAFNILFLVTGFFLMMKIRREAQWKKAELQNFEIVDDDMDGDDDSRSSTDHSILRPLKYD